MVVKDQKEDELYEINFESFFRGIKNYIYKKKFSSIIFVFISLIIFASHNRAKVPMFLGDFSISLQDRDYKEDRDYKASSNFYNSSIRRQILILSSEKSLQPLIDYYNLNPLKKKFIDKDFSYTEFSKLVRPIRGYRNM